MQNENEEVMEEESKYDVEDEIHHVLHDIIDSGFYATHYIKQGGKIVSVAKVMYSLPDDWIAGTSSEYPLDELERNIGEYELEVVGDDFDALSHTFLSYLKSSWGDGWNEVELSDKKAMLKDFWQKYWIEKCDDGEISSHNLGIYVAEYSERIDRLQE